MRDWFARLALALGGALALFTTGVVPAEAAPAVAPVAPVAHVRVGFPVAPAARVAAALAYLRTHPIQGRAMPLSQPAGGAPRTFAGVWRYWWGVRVYLTATDVRTLFYSLVIYGTTATVAAMCAGVPVFEAVCGAAGIIAGYFIADAVWRAGVSRHGCGLYVDIYWNAFWRSWGC